MGAPLTQAERIAALTDSERLKLAKQWVAVLWGRKGQHMPEEKRIDRHREICIELCSGDAKRGEQLAREAICS